VLYGIIEHSNTFIGPSIHPTYVEKIHEVAADNISSLVIHYFTINLVQNLNSEHRSYGSNIGITFP
jgi:hypothetical protein